jgi:F-type H+-transporting ATPase subunit epsilon
MATPFRLELVTPEGSAYEGASTAVQLPGVDGLFQVLHNHAPLVAALAAGVVKVDLADGPTRRFAIDGGLVEVLANRVVVLAQRVTEA